MILDSLVLREASGGGLGLFATEAVPRGTITMLECLDCKTISLAKARESSRWDFIASHAPVTGGTYPHFLEPCDVRIYYGNHACDANTLDTHLGFDIAVCDIRAGEELTVDYRRFFDSTIDFECLCGAEHCCRRVLCRRPEPEVERHWERLLKLALPALPTVDQPLLRSPRAGAVSHLPLEAGARLDPRAWVHDRVNRS